MTTSVPTTGGAPSDPLVGQPAAKSSTLSEWVGPYVTNMLGQAYAVSQQPYQVYQGPLTAGASPLQQQAFTGIGSLTAPTGINAAATTAGGIADKLGGMSYSPTTFTNPYAAPAGYDPTTFKTDMWSSQQAQQYMNPFLQQALDPQLRELTRSADISRLADVNRLSSAGAYGGSRQAIMEAEARRNLLGKQSDVLSEGYKTAYDKAQESFKSDQQRALDAQQATEKSKQFGATYAQDLASTAAKYGLDTAKLSEDSKQFGAKYGLDALAQQLSAAKAQGDLSTSGLKAQQSILDMMMGAGATQRDIEQAGITADYNEFLAQRDYPQKMTQYLQSMLQGLPVETTSASYMAPDDLSQLGGDMGMIMEWMRKAGIIKD